MKRKNNQWPESFSGVLSDGAPSFVVKRYAKLPEMASKNEYGQFDNNVVVIDTEATGLSVKTEELTQIAAARVEKGKISGWYVSFVNPGKTITEDVQRLTGISNEDVENAPSPSQAIQELVEFIGDSIVVAHNVAFDKEHITKHASGYPLLENMWIDTLHLARITLPWMNSHRLGDLARAFECPKSTHRADADVVSTCALLRILLAGVDSMPLELISQVAHMADIKDWNTGIVFSYFEEKKKTASGGSNNSASFNLRSMRNNKLRFLNQNNQKTVETEEKEGQSGPHKKESLEGILNTDKHNTDKHNTVECTTKERSTEECESYGALHKEVTSQERSSLKKEIHERMEENLWEESSQKENPCEDNSQNENSWAGNSQKEHLGKEHLGKEHLGKENLGKEHLGKEHLGKENTCCSQRTIDAEELAKNPLKEIIYPTENEIERAFCKSGLVGKLYNTYEQREEQVSMALGITQAFSQSKNAIIEAGTGVGKSMAYLVPSSLLALKNNICVGIATKTNALLDQLVYHELPELAQQMPGLNYSPLKGHTHYICMQKVEELLRCGAQNKEYAGTVINTAPSIASVLSFIEQSEYEDCDVLKIDYWVVPRWKVTSNSRECLRRKCPYYKQGCFVYGARARTKSAHIVVTNQSLLFCDIVTEGALLPPIRYWIIDEAHGVEEQARRAYSVSLSAEELLYLARKLGSEQAAQNPIIRAKRQVTGAVQVSALANQVPAAAQIAPSQAEAATFLYVIIEKTRAAGADFAIEAEDFALHLKEMKEFDKDVRKGAYQTTEIWINDKVRNSSVFKDLQQRSSELCNKTAKLIETCQNLVALLEDYKGSYNVQQEIALLTLSCISILDSTKVVFGSYDENYVYSLLLNRRSNKHTERCDALLLEVGDTLNQALYAQTHSVVFTSATLAIGNSFSAFEKAIGFNTCEESRGDCLQLPSSYDYDSLMTIYVARDMPEPNTSAYLVALGDFLTECHKAQQGSMLSLFTNRQEMEASFDVVNQALKCFNLPLRCQKKGVSIKALRDEFLAVENLSLFALKSFWEGFDAPGETLRGVIIPKLPFMRLGDPLSCERELRDGAAAWRNYVLPAAVLAVKQAAGRLIRNSTDTGRLILADSRLLSKNYGKDFLNSLPSTNIKILTRNEIIKDIEKNRE